MNFFDFISEEKRNQEKKGLEFSNQIASRVQASAYSMGMPAAKKGDNLQQLARSIASDDSFLKEFSDQIGEPHDSESEDEFVARAKQKLVTMLSSKLDVKK